MYNTYLEATQQLQDKQVQVDQFSRGTVENQKGDIYSVCSITCSDTGSAYTGVRTDIRCGRTLHVRQLHVGVTGYGVTDPVLASVPWCGA